MRGALEAMIVNTAGGIAGGDRHDLDIRVEGGRGASVTTAAAEKVYRALGPDAEIAVKLSVGADGRLNWLPQETILFDRARLKRRIEVELARGASLVMAEAVVFGRAAMGEAVEQGTFTDRWRVRRDGRLLFAETMRLDGAIAGSWPRPRSRAAASQWQPCWRCPAIRRWSSGRASKLSVARSACRPGTGLRWRGSAPRMARACGAILPRWSRRSAAACRGCG